MTIGAAILLVTHRITSVLECTYDVTFALTDPNGSGDALATAEPVPILLEAGQVAPPGVVSTLSLSVHGWTLPKLNFVPFGKVTTSDFAAFGLAPGAPGSFDSTSALIPV